MDWGTWLATGRDPESWFARSGSCQGFLGGQGGLLAEESMTGWSNLSPLSWCGLSCAALLAVCTLAWGWGSGELWGNEGLRARVAAEMANPANQYSWRVPRLEGEPLLTKPPLHYWIVATLGRITGRVGPFEARLPSLLAGVGLLGLACWQARRFAGWDALLATLLVMPCSLAFLTQVPSAELDLPLAFWVFATLFCLGRQVDSWAANPEGWGLWWWGVAVCGLAGFLSKWTAPVFVLPVVVVCLATAQGCRQRGGMAPVAGGGGGAGRLAAPIALAPWSGLSLSGMVDLSVAGAGDGFTCHSLAVLRLFPAKENALAGLAKYLDQVAGFGGGVASGLLDGGAGPQTTPCLAGGATARSFGSLGGRGLPGQGHGARKARSAGSPLGGCHALDGCEGGPGRMAQPGSHGRSCPHPGGRSGVSGDG